MKLSKSQAGFTPVHALLGLIIISIIGFAGWKVYGATQTVVTPDPGVKVATNIQEPKTPSKFVELKIDSLILYYPKAQGPPLDTSNQSNKSTDGLLVRSYNLKDVHLLVYEADNYIYTMGLGVPYMCAYNKVDNSFAGRPFSNYPPPDCSKRTIFSDINFFTHEIVYEGLATVRYMTPTRDKKYIIYISSNSVNLTIGDSDEKLIAEDKARVNSFMEQFVPANKNALLGLSK